MNVFEAVFVRPWPWWAAGAAVGAFVTLFAWVTGKALGVSSGFGSICATCVPRVPYFQKRPYTDSWRLWFLAGIPLGGLAGALLDGPWRAVTAMPAFDAAITSSLPLKLVLLFVGGALSGYAARWADG